MKKVLSFIGALTLLSNSMIISNIYAEDITSVDVLTSKKVVLNIIEPTKNIISKYDTNDDSIINVIDVINLKNSCLIPNNIDLSKYQLISGYDNLYNIMEISNSSANAYVSVDNVGNNLIICNRFADGMLENVYYDLSLYNVYEGKISYSLKNIYFDDYYVVDDKIMLWNYKEKSISTYDNTLKLINTYDISSFFNQDDWISFYTCDSTSVVYLYNNDTSIFYRINLNDALKYDTFYFPYYYSNIYNITKDGKLIANGLNNKTLKNELVYWNLEKNSAEHTLNINNCYSVVDNSVLISENYDNNVWSIQNVNQDKNYFEIKNVQTIELNSNKNIISTTDDGSNRYINIYDINGINKATLKFNHNNSYYYNIKQISNTNYYYIINATFDGKYTIMLWDSNNSSNGENLKNIPNYTSTKSVIGNIDSLSELYLKAQNIGNKYGINVYIGDTIVETSSEYLLSQCLDKNIINNSLDKLDEILSCYPNDFFTQLCVENISQLNFYLTGTIEGNMEGSLDFAGGFVSRENNSLNLTIDCNSYDYWESTLNHEISHLIDTKLSIFSTVNENAIFNEDTWENYNPDGFEYTNSYDQYWNNVCNYDYFIRDYSTTFPTEDRAEIFSYAMECYLNPNTEDYFISANTGKGKKLKYYCDAIRDSFDTSNWQNVMPWEKVLYSTTYKDTFVFHFEHDGVYTIQNLGSGKYLNVDYGKDINATNVYQWTGDGSTEQKFRLNVFEKSYQINAMCSSNGYNKTLDIVKSNGNVISGANVEIYEPIDNIAQEWLFVEVESGVYKIVPKYNTNLALSVCGNSNGSANGTTSTSNGNAFVSTYTGDNNQKWILTKMD